jgi:hypothetical protein
MRRPGLTRVEVVLIAAATVLLAGVAAVLISRSRENGMRLQCMNNLRRIGTAMHTFHTDRGFLAPGRIDDDYATWAVLLAPHLEEKHPLSGWDQSQTYFAQDDKVREAIVTYYFCPARPRSGLLSIAGDVDPASTKHLAGALGDYAGVAGSGDPAHSWDGPNADGLCVVGEVLERAGGRIVRWRGRVRLPELAKDAQGRGQSTTLLVGEKHVPSALEGRAAGGDGSLYNGQNPASSVRIAGPGFGLAESGGEPFNHNFGSAHPGLCQFLQADGGVRAFTVDVSEAVLGALARRQANRAP